MGNTTRHTHTRLKAEDRRAQILDAATSLLGTRGFWGTSLQDVADACEFTVTGILYHFPTKEELLEAVLDAADAGFTDAVIRELAHEGPVEEAVRSEAASPEVPDGQTTGGGHPEESGIWRLCRILIRLDVANPDRARLYTVLETEVIEPEHPVHDYFVQRERRLVGHFQSTVPRGVEDREALARRAMAVVSGFRLQWLKAGGVADPVRTWEQMNIALREMLGECGRGTAPQP